MDVLEKLKTLNHLSHSEEVIARYVIEHLEEIPHLSSRELANKTYTSAPTIVRFSKKLGYETYTEFKYNIGLALKNMPIDTIGVVSDEDLLSLVQKTAQMEYMAISKMKEMIEINTLNEVVKALDQVSYVDIIANDTNAKLGDYFAHLLMQVGKIANVYQNTDQQLHLSLNANQDHLVFMLSKHARNKRLVKMAKTFRQKHIEVVYISGIEDNLISKECPYVFKTPFMKQSEKGMEIIYFTSVKYVFDLIYNILLSKNYDKSNRMLDLYNEIFF